ncbi:MAG: hypothetical protein R3F54_17190 [Alphaproteobacteria bacterium]
MARKGQDRVITWLVMVALIAQTWLAPLALATAGDELGGLVICTGTGYKVIPLPTDDDAPSSDAPARRSAGFDCIACLHGVLGQAGVASAALLPLPVKHDVVSIRPINQRSPSAPGFGAAKSRSPPIV